MRTHANVIPCHAREAHNGCDTYVREHKAAVKEADQMRGEAALVPLERAWQKKTDTQIGSAGQVKEDDPYLGRTDVLVQKSSYVP